jgi:predicted ATP-grasp superfamily ATP-dependent carboligase
MKVTSQRFLNKVDHENLCIVIGLNNTNGLSIIRDLSDHNVTTIGLGERQISIGRFSKHCNHYIRYKGKEELLQTLTWLGNNLRPKVPIFVTSDDLVIFLEKNRDILSKSFLFYWQTKTKLEDIIDKSKMIEYAKAAGLEVPSAFFSGNSSLELIEKKIEFPSIVKPTHTKSRTKGILVYSKEEFREAVKDRLFEDSYIVQKFIPGSNSDIFMIGTFSDEKGNMIANSIAIKQRTMPKEMGISTSAISVENNLIKRQAEKFTRYLEYYGPADIEIKRSSIDGKYMFIEINPRFSSCNQLFRSSGCHLAYVSYLALKKELKEEKGYFYGKSGTRFISLTKDLATILMYYKNVNIYKWLKSLQSYNSYAVFSKKDPVPFIVDIFIRIRGLIIIKAKKSANDQFKYKSSISGKEP